jgi:signal peptidase I
MESLNQPKKIKFYETWTFVIIVCILLPICFRTFMYSPRHIPSGSMKPNLLEGDFLFISKLAYGYSRYSFPMGYKIKYFDGRIGGDKPVRGDIIVFRPPNNPQVDYIKRLIAVPGDRIAVVDGKVILNGVYLKTERIEDYVTVDDGRKKTMKRYIEYLPNGVAYQVLDEHEGGQGDNIGEIKVPQGYYFFMGDNRDNSQDSRFMVGLVPKENLIGRADLLVFSNNASLIKIWEWVVSFREGRSFRLFNNEFFTEY